MSKKDDYTLIKSDGVGRLLHKIVIPIDTADVELSYIDTTYFNRDGSITTISELILHQSVWSYKETYID